MRRTTQKGGLLDKISQPILGQMILVTSQKRKCAALMKNMTLDYEVMRCSKGIHGICSSSSQVLVVLVLSLSLGLGSIF